VKAGGVPVSVRSGAGPPGREASMHGSSYVVGRLGFSGAGPGGQARIPALPGPGLAPGGAVEDGRAVPTAGQHGTQPCAPLTLADIPTATGSKRLPAPRVLRRAISGSRQ
jgi:hypothetical protein